MQQSTNGKIPFTDFKVEYLRLQTHYAFMHLFTSEIFIIKKKNASEAPSY